MLNLISAFPPLALLRAHRRTNSIEMEFQSKEVSLYSRKRLFRDFTADDTRYDTSRKVQSHSFKGAYSMLSHPTDVTGTQFLVFIMTTMLHFVHF